MPIRDRITAFDAENFDPTTFDPRAFKAELLAEFDQDETAWRAAITERDGKISTGAAALQSQQSKNWELLQQIPGQHDDATKGQKPDPEDDPTNVGFDDIFTTEGK